MLYKVHKYAKKGCAVYTMYTLHTMHTLRGTWCTYLGAHGTNTEVGDDALIAMS